MEVRKDSIYSFEIARRSVGRAAEHLGVEKMTEASLDVMADILLQYLNRVGRSLSILVESSGRTSAHVNLLDTLQACQVVTSPAVTRLHLRNPEVDDPMELFAGAGAATATAAVEGGASADATSAATSMTATPTNGLNAVHTADWKGLAAFLFGPRWLDVKEDEEEQKEKEVQGAGGKVGPSATGDGDDAKQRSNKRVGWKAPYLDEVPHFPQKITPSKSDRRSCANPHPLPPNVGLSLHRLEVPTEENAEEQASAEQEKELEQVPDDAFFTNTPWGHVVTPATASAEDDDATKKRKLDEGDKDTTKMDVDAASPPTKKVKIDDSKARAELQEKQQQQQQDLAKEMSQYRDPTLPYFYPPLPPPAKLVPSHGRIVVDVSSSSDAAADAAAATATATAATATVDEKASLKVRSSLIQLGTSNMSQAYWGSGWDNNPKSSANSKLGVPFGRAERPEASSTSAIVPLKRASGSRVSRILEGSMDASAMQ